MATSERLRDTARRFTFEIAAITAGILIALSLDAVVERNRERALVRQARVGIAREIADNRQDLDGGLKSLDKHVQDLAQGPAARRRLVEGRYVRHSQAHPRVLGPQPQPRGVATAKRTGGWP